MAGHILQVPVFVGIVVSTSGRLFLTLFLLCAPSTARTMLRHSGDDFNDDYVPDDLVAVSDASEDLSQDEGGEEFVGFGAGPSVSHLNAATDKKRKRREKDKQRRKVGQLIILRISGHKHRCLEKKAARVQG